MRIFRETVVNARVVFFGCWLMLLVPAIGPGAHAQLALHWPEPGEQAVGFRLLERRDRTRVVAAPAEHARPVRVYVWYPAKPSPEARPLAFRRYTDLAEDDVWRAEVIGALHESLSFSRGAFARSLGPGGLESLGTEIVGAYEDADPLPGPFPLIVIGQGLYYESPVSLAALSEHLASRGFVVATSPLMGTDSPVVKLDLEDLETQVRDLEFVIATARALGHVSPEALGVLGFDMGGMASLLLAMRHSGVDAFASVSSAVLFPHPSGLPASSPGYAPAKLRIPWLHVGAQRPTLDEPSLFETAVHAERYRVQVDGLEHVDPTSYALVEARAARAGMWSAWRAGGVEKQETIHRYVSEFFAAFLMEREESLEFLTASARAVTPSVGLTVEHRAAIAPSISYAELVDALVTGDAASAIDRVRRLAAAEPSHTLASDFYLYRLAYSLLYSWGLSEASIQLAELNVELNPTSGLATRILSMNHVERGDYDQAIEAYRALLRKSPDDDDTRRTIEWLRGQQELSRRRD